MIILAKGDQQIRIFVHLRLIVKNLFQFIFIMFHILLDAMFPFINLSYPLENLLLRQVFLLHFDNETVHSLSQIL